MQGYEGELHGETAIIHRLQGSEIHINTAISLDILYNIFMLAVYDSFRPMKTVLAISYVCRHWRSSAIGWSALWGFIDLRASLAVSIVDLFLSRSKNAPLTISLETKQDPPSIKFDNWISYLESKADHIFPRLRSFILYCEDVKLLIVQSLFRKSTLSPLQLRSLDITVYTEAPENRTNWPSQPADLIQYDPLTLTSVDLCGMDLPSFNMPHLTRFIFLSPVNPPIVSHLLGFLSHCPLLCELELSVSFNDNPITTTAMTASPLKPHFPNLKQLRLSSQSRASYNYIRDVSTHIQTLTSVSEFELHYLDSRSDDLFKSVPDGAFSCCRGHHFIILDLRVVSYRWFSFKIFSAPSRTPRADCPFNISGSLSPPALDSYDFLLPILDLIRLMRITHLVIGPYLWEVIFSWVQDFPGLFSCVDTLELDFTENRLPGQINLALGLLPANLNIKTLILKQVELISCTTLLRVVSRIKMEYLEMVGSCYFHPSEGESAEVLLGKKGVVVSRSENIKAESDGSYYDSEYDSED